MKIMLWLLVSVSGFLVGCGGGGGSHSGNRNLSSAVTQSSVAQSSLAQSSAATNRAPQNFTIQATNINNHSISISWLNSTDADNDVLKYRVRVNDQLVNEDLAEKSTTLSKLLPNTQYQLTVEAVDPQGLMTSSTLSLRTRNDDGELSLHSMQLDGGNRHYVVFSPANPEGKKLPLVIWFHGAGYQLPQTILQDYWISLAQREQFILLAPVAINDIYETFTYWNAGLGTHKDDVLLTKTAIDSLAAQGLIDTDRVYAAGMSSGGHMAFYTAYKLQDQIAAVAPIAGSITLYTLYPTPASPGVFDFYQISKPMPICHIHGDADSIVNIKGGTWYASWEKIRARWINANKVNATPTSINLPDVSKSDGSTVTKFEYRGATPASDIDDYLIRGGSHSIPGIESSANQDMNAYEVIWEFFKRHKLSDPY